MVPLLFVVDRASTRRRASLLCWLAGTVGVGGGFYWMIELLGRFADLSLPVNVLLYLAFSAYHGSIFLLFGWMVRTIRRRKSCPMVLLAPLAMATSELLVPMLFPFHLAIVQAWHPLVIQIADLAGPIGVTALLMVVNGALYDLVTQRRKGLASAAAAAVILGAVLLYGHFRIRHFDVLSASALKLSIGVVQPNIAYNQKGVYHPEEAAGQLAALQEQSRALEKRGAQVIVWSETAYPYSLSRDFRSDFPESDERRIRRGFTIPTVVGTLTGSEAGSDLYNSAVLIDREGQQAGRYDKMVLLPFGEHFPGEEYFPWLGNMLPEGFGGFQAGKEPTVLPLKTADGNSWRLGAAICYEDIIPGLLRRMGAQHPHVLVNVTNDSWYGARAEPWQHLALAVFGSIEQRTGMVRAVNSGISAFIDANGRVVQKTEAIDPYVDPRPADSTLATLPLLEAGGTVYAKVGDLFAYVCALCIALWLAWPVLLRRFPSRRLRQIAGR